MNLATPLEKLRYRTFFPTAGTAKRLPALPEQRLSRRALPHVPPPARLLPSPSATRRRREPPSSRRGGSPAAQPASRNTHSTRHRPPAGGLPPRSSAKLLRPRSREPIIASPGSGPPPGHRTTPRPVPEPAQRGGRYRPAETPGAESPTRAPGFLHTILFTTPTYD